MSVEKVFTSVVEQMLLREEYLFPYVWAQRLFRQDNYQMASQALLEDMFFDTLGDYLHRHAPGHTLVRRTGAESWDYMLDGQGFSHKEGISRLITTKWRAGEGPGNKIPKWPTWTFSEPVVFSYTNPKTHLKVTSEMSTKKGKAVSVTRVAKPLTHVTQSDFSFMGTNTWVIFGAHDRTGGVLRADHVWPRETWEKFDVHQMRQIASDAPAGSDFWLYSLTQQRASRGIDPANEELPITFTVNESDLPSGVYVLSKADVTNLPLASNNKAHFVTAEGASAVMTKALDSGGFIPLPLWPAVYADLTPPNLYRDQKERYEELFRARTVSV